MATTETVTASSDTPVQTPGKMSLPTLTGMVVGSMVGAGVFSLPARFGVATGILGSLIAWGIAGLGMLMLALVAVVGLAKLVSPSIEAGVVAVGFPNSFVGVVIALLVLLPESIAAVRAARRNRIQTSINLALGSAMASIGLTIPAIAVASFFLDGPLLLGLGPTQIVLLLLTVVVSILTIAPGRATRLQGGVHLAVFAAFIFLSIAP